MHERQITVLTNHRITSTITSVFSYAPLRWIKPVNTYKIKPLSTYKIKPLSTYKIKSILTPKIASALILVTDQLIKN